MPKETMANCAADQERIDLPSHLKQIKTNKKTMVLKTGHLGNEGP